MISTLSTNCLTRTYEIRMPQMSNQALSENWLWKELGDIHWELLGQGLGIPCAELTDAQGQRIYPTFVRIALEGLQLHRFKENTTLTLEANLKRYGESTCISEITGYTSEDIFTARLMTVFSSRGAKGNTRLNRQAVFTSACVIEELDQEPAFLLEYRSVQRQMRQSLMPGTLANMPDDKALFETEYRINPYTDINGVGLLYFAAYPLISDYCEMLYAHQAGIHGWARRYHTRDRDIHFFRNCEVGDQVIYRLHSVERIDGGDMALKASLLRKSDGAMMASITSTKTRQSCDQETCATCPGKIQSIVHNHY